MNRNKGHEVAIDGKEDADKSCSEVKGSSVFSINVIKFDLFCSVLERFENLRKTKIEEQQNKKHVLGH
jgi:hypothetical protein